MRALVLKTLSSLHQCGIDYADCRIVRRLVQEITVKNNYPEAVKYSESIGMGIRVLINGAWGFAATADLSARAINACARRAVAVARSSNRLPAAVPERLANNPVVNDVYVTPHKIDPFNVSLEEKLEILTRATEIMLKQKKITVAQSFFNAMKEEKLFGSTEGSLIEQTIIHCGGGIMAYAVDNGEVQHRSYPSNFRGNFSTAGWEFFQSLNLVENAERVATEALALLKAPPCPAGKTTIILTDDQLALQVHESIGHAIELDRVFGYEASFAGKSFLDPQMLGKFQYGSPQVNVVADATVPGGLGTFGYDDEGVPAQRTPIITEGIFKGFLTSRALAPRINQTRSNGTMRADGWENFPLIRMTNINLEPGEWDLDALIADTKDGLLLETNKSWSIDDRRINFQFSTEVARQIKNGKLGVLYKNPIYTGITWEFWRSCDAVCNKKWWQLWGTPNCGKGEPMQTMYVGHGVAPARFRNVTVGSTK